MTSLRNLFVVSLLALCTACAGTPVSMGSHGEAPEGRSRAIIADACGFQLLLLIPIAVNGRVERAYHRLEREAAGDFITNVQVRERWTWGFLGTSYCTTIGAQAIHRDVAGGALNDGQIAPASATTTPPPAVAVAPGTSLSAVATLKAQPRKASQTLGSVPADATVTPTSRVRNEEGNWLFVQYGAESGWILDPAAGR